jgi:ribosomal protein S27AE
MKLPKRTTCGDCHAIVKLKLADWLPFHDGPELHGYVNHTRCPRCKSNVVAALGSPVLFAFLKAQYAGATVDETDPGTTH